MHSLVIYHFLPEKKPNPKMENCNSKTKQKDYLRETPFT